MDKYNSTIPPRNKKDSVKDQSSLGQELISTVLYVIILSSLFFVVQRYLYAPVMVEGDSMEATLSDGDYLLLDRIGEIKRFDVIIFPLEELSPSLVPDDEERLYVKRVIGLPGDSIEFQGDQLYLNGEEVHENYIDYSFDYNFASFSLETLFGVPEVPEGHYFVLGDNRTIGGSLDSREFGFVDQDYVLGKVSYRYWPLSDFGKINKEVEK